MSSYEESPTGLFKGVRHNTYACKRTVAAPVMISPVMECCDSDSDEDEKERRKYISLKGGQGFLWFANKFSNQWDLTNDNYELYSNNLENRHTVECERTFKRNGSGRHSFKHKRCMSNTPLFLDKLHITNELEYGFNLKRPKGSKGHYTVRIRPISLYSPPLERPRSMVGNNKTNFSFEGLSADDSVSFAKNDFELLLDQEVKSLRAQPSSLNIHGCQGNTNEEELAEDLKIARRRRFVKRQLSFDSHPRQQMTKALSLESILDGDRNVKSFPYRMKSEKPCSSEEFLIDLNNEVDWPKKLKKKKSVQSGEIFDSTNQPDSSPVDENISPINVLPSPDLVEKIEEVKLNGTSGPVDKPGEKPKRRSSIPNLLSSLRLPNRKTLKRLIRNKKQQNSHRSPTVPLKVPHKPVTLDLTSVDSRDSCVEVKDALVKTEVKTIPAISSTSLARVDEDKESFEFSSPLERRSCSTCSIPVNTAAVRNDKSPLERRLSDTALADKQPHQIGLSPGRRFVRKLLSPVVCGLPSPDRYATFNESTTSLTSCETASITSDSDVNTGGLLLLEFGTQDLTDELTLIDKELLIRISWEELSKCGWMSHEKFLLAPNVMKMVQFFNRVAMMVTTSILAEETPYRRAKVIRKAIKLAMRCRFMKNYNSLKAVLSGMQCTPIFRLKASWKQVPSRYRRLFRELSELMSENNNFSLYQKELLTASQNPPSLPFLGNFLTAVAHTYAFKAVHGKYNKNNAQTNSPVTNFPQANSSPSTNFPQTHTPQEAVLVDFSSKNHSRSNSNDSGVVLRMFSHVSDDCDVSPRESESCLSSPEDEQATSIEEVFHKHNKSHDLRHMTHKRRCSSQEPINEQSSRPYRKSVSVDNGSTKYYADINDMINKRPVEPLVRDPLFDCQLQFWKFQISGVQYNIIPRPFIRRFLVNSPFNTEEKSYKLSLQHEPPTHLL